MEGESGFGYGDGDDVTQINMRGKHTALYTRTAFDLKEKPAGDKAQLRIRYDDGFIAYLNGEEIARRSVKGTPGESEVSSHGGQHLKLLIYLHGRGMRGKGRMCWRLWLQRQLEQQRSDAGSVSSSNRA